jgi:hypothetical protein
MLEAISGWNNQNKSITNNLVNQYFLISQDFFCIILPEQQMFYVWRSIDLSDFT